MEDFDRFSVKQLQILCREREIQHGGKNKAHLVRLLTEHQAMEARCESSQHGENSDDEDADDLEDVESDGDADDADDIQEVEQLAEEASLVETRSQNEGTSADRIRRSTDILSAEQLFELEKLRIAADERKARIAADERRAQIEERKAELAAQTEQARIQLELAKLQHNPQQAVEIKPRVPFTLPSYRETDSVDAFLQNFEKACTDSQIPKQQWLSRMRPQSSGKLQEILNTLPLEESSNYDLAKPLILKRFHKTPEDNRRQFRTTRPLPSESYVDFTFRLQKLAKNWWDGRKVESRDDLEQVMLVEQFLEKIPTPLRLFLLDKGDKNLRELAELADDYTLARSPDSFESWSRSFTEGGVNSGSNQRKKHRYTKWNNNGQQTHNSQIQNQTQVQSQPQAYTPPPLNPEARAQRKCFSCNRPGHIARDCRSKPQKPQNLQNTSAFCQIQERHNRPDKHISEG